GVVRPGMCFVSSSADHGPFRSGWETEGAPTTASTQSKVRTRGSSDLSVLPIGLGAISLSDAHGKSNDDERPLAKPRGLPVRTGLYRVEAGPSSQYRGEG